MSTPKIQAIIDNFVAELSAALRDASYSAISQALGETPGKAAPKASSARAPRAAKASARAKGAKRSPEELKQLTRSLLAHIKKTPGQRIEQIGAALGATTKDLVLPAKKLLGEKAIKTKGARRATTYFPN